LHVTGIDISHDMIRAAKKRNLELAKKNGHHVSFVQGDCIEYLKNCKDGEYDLAIADFLLSEIGCSDLFTLVSRILKKGGRFSILTVSDDHLRGLEKVFFKFLMANPSIPNWHSVSAAVVMKKISKTIPYEKIIKLLHDNKFSKIEGSSKPIMCQVHFDDPVSFLRWFNKSMWALQYSGFIKEDKRGGFAEEAAKYLEKKNVKIVGEPVRYGKPFTFTMPIYSIIAEK
jgi:SAM-dependent methyltransferase